MLPIRDGRRKVRKGHTTFREVRRHGAVAVELTVMPFCGKSVNTFCHSRLRVSAGSMRVALQAGTRQAVQATPEWLGERGRK